MKFEQLSLIEPLLQAIHKKGYLIPTPIQEKAIPAILSGKDLFGVAQTGTGKTAAFALPILQLLTTERDRTQRRNVRALILAPTRELASQISEEFYVYSKGLNIKLLTVYGGVSQRPQTQALQKGVDVMVATPGRLLDLIQQGYIALNKIEFFVLDEADRMLDMGFINDIKKIIAKLPNRRQTMLFSATSSPEVKNMASSLLDNPVTVNLAPVASPPSLVSQKVYHVSQENKKLLLAHVLQDELVTQALVFTRTKRGAEKVVKDLSRQGIKADAIHGDKSQNAREKALKAFKNNSIRVLVATDVASRGIDVDRLSHVINFEIPEEAETYVHRIGRTGRAEHQGAALSFCSGNERMYLKNIHKLIKHQIDVVHSHPFVNIHKN
ncbi:MAG: DEAD/DEAH box helicase [Bacteroidales bacterium]|nr:DEAD/DEAH box helicase [Bacteroidales bacterium]